MKYLHVQTVFCISLLMFLLSTSAVFSQQPPDTVIHWKTVEQVQRLMKTNPRPTMTFFYMPGEDSSMKMLENIFIRREICMYTNSMFYAVKIDVTSFDSIHWFDNKTYTRKASNTFNDLIPHLFGEKLVFPSLLFYNLETAGFTFRGYKSRYELRCLLVYFAEEIEKTTPYELWAQAYKIAYPPINFPDPLKSSLQWHSLSEAQALQKQKPKDLFINWYARLNVGSNVMLYAAFENPRVAEYLNEHFYCVRLDAQTKDTLYWQKPYYNELTKGNFHQLALEQLEGKMKFPSLLFFDKDKKLLIKQQSYLGPLNLFALANYVGSGSYKTMKFQNFIKTFKPDF